MKKIFTTLLICLAALLTKAQSVQYLGVPGNRIEVRGQLQVDSLIFVGQFPDTSRVPNRNGAFLWNTTDKRFYLYNSIKWFPIAGDQGTGITSLNALTGSAQTFANGAAGTAPGFVSSSTTHTLNIPMASAGGVTAGLLSKTDYDIFNAKQPALSGTTNYVAKWSSASNLGNSVMYDDGTNIGIGRIPGSYRLDIAGSLNTDSGYRQRTYFTLVGSDSVTKVGRQALNANTTGVNNTAVGYQNLFNNTTGSTNTAIGAQSLFSNTTGTGNEAFGYQALYNNTTGSTNTALGGQSLFANTTGSQNFAVGMQALKVNTTGSQNTAMGYLSSFSNTTGSGNLSIGYNSLYNNTSGAQNVAIGPFALYSNSTGSFNVAIGTQASYSNANSWNVALGYQALYTNTGPSNNAIGYQAIYSNTSGTGNGGFGYQSLFSNTTGNNNNAWGFFALKSTTTGSNNTAIGSYALQSNTIASSNNAIGYQALQANTIGAFNTAIGQEALYSHIKNDQNTAIGYRALYFDTTGTQNVAIGTQALYNNLSGTFNVGIGNQASLSNTTGSNNLAFGTQALNLNTTGSTNIAFGYQSLFNNTTSSDNIAFGGSTLSNLFSGAGNVGAGTSAGQSLRKGDQNVAIGYWSMKNADSASLNISIGSSAMATASGIRTNNVAIGNSAMYAGAGSFNTAIGSNAIRTNSGDNNVAIGYLAGMNDVSATFSRNVILGYQAGYNWLIGSGRLVIDASTTIAPQPLLYGDFEQDSLKVNAYLHVRDTVRIDNIPTTPGTNDSLLVARNNGGVYKLAQGSLLAIGAFGSTPNANGLSLTTNPLTLVMQPASASFPGGVSTTTQSIAGDKTLTNNLTVNLNITSGQHYLFSGVESSAATLTLAALDDYVFNGTTTTWTLPVLASSQGIHYHIKNAGSGAITLQRAGADQLYDAAAVTSISIAAGAAKTIVARASFWYVE